MKPIRAFARVCAAASRSIICPLIILLAACSGGPSGPAAIGDPGITVVSGIGVSDTVGARPPEVLTIELRSADGRVQESTLMRFESSNAERLEVGGVEGLSFGPFASVLTDRNGRASVRVRFRTSAGQALLYISAPNDGPADTVSYTVLPGAPVAVQIFPRDTAIALDESLTLRSTWLDRFGNPLLDGPGVVEELGDVLTSPSSITFTGTSTGVGMIRVVSHADDVMRDSIAVVVAPEARVAWWYSHVGIVTTDLLGRDTAVVVQPPALDPAYHSSGDPMTYVVNDTLYVDSAAAAPVPVPTPGLDRVRYPQMSRDGEWIWFQAETDNITHVFRIRPDGTGLENFTHGTGGREPSPAPDRPAVVWARDNFIIVRDLETGIDRIIEPEAIVHGPRWSPDGDWIAYVRSWDSALMVVRPDGSDHHQVGLRGVEMPLSWSPDSRMIIALSGSGTGFADLASGFIGYLPFSAHFPAWIP